MKSINVCINNLNNEFTKSRESLKTHINQIPNIPSSTTFFKKLTPFIGCRHYHYTRNEMIHNFKKDTIRTLCNFKNFLLLTSLSARRTCYPKRTRHQLADRGMHPRCEWKGRNQIYLAD